MIRKEEEEEEEVMRQRERRLVLEENAKCWEVEEHGIRW